MSHCDLIKGKATWAGNTNNSNGGGNHSTKKAGKMLQQTTRAESMEAEATRVIKKKNMEEGKWTTKQIIKGIINPGKVKGVKVAGSSHWMSSCEFQGPKNPK